MLAGDAACGVREFRIACKHGLSSLGQLVVGRLIDLYGPRLLFLVGTSLTGIAGLVGLLAPNLFATLGIAIKTGRDISDTDTQERPFVAVATNEKPMALDPLSPVIVTVVGIASPVFGHAWVRRLRPNVEPL